MLVPDFTIVFPLIVLLVAFGTSIGWTVAGFDDAPDVGRSRFMQKNNSALRTTTLVLSSIANYIAIVYLMIVIATMYNIGDTHTEHIIGILASLLYMTAASLSIANVTTSNRKTRGDTLGITTITFNAIAVVAVLYTMLGHFAKSIN